MDKLDTEVETFNDACRDIMRDFAYGILAARLESRGVDFNDLVDFMLGDIDLDHGTLKKLLISNMEDENDPTFITYGISKQMLDYLEDSTLGEASNDNRDL